MRTIRILTAVAIVLGLSMNAYATRWSNLKIWKKKDVTCVDGCVENGNCVDDCVSLRESVCNRFSHRKSQCKKAYNVSRHWISDVCKKECLKIRRIKWMRGNDSAGCCDEGCVDDCIFSQGSTDQWVPPVQEAPALKKTVDAPMPEKAVRLPQLKPMKRHKPLQSPKVFPAPKAKKKRNYVPADDKTSFMMPRPKIQKLVGYVN